MSKGIGGKVGNGPSRSSNSSSGDCFVATAAFGTPLAKEIQVLRWYRDNKLRKSVTGRKFISFYYKYGPHVARSIRKYPLFKRMIRGLIKCSIPLIRK